MKANTLHTQFFSLPRPSHLTDVKLSPNRVILHFEHSGFEGKIDICTHTLKPDQNTYDDHENPGSDWHYLRQNSPRAQKNDDFEEFFRHCIMFPNDEHDAENVPTQTGDIEGLFSIGAFQMTPDGKFRYVVAIDVDHYHYITFFATYEKIDGEVRPDKKGRVPKELEKALNAVWHYYIDVLNRMHIKTNAVRQDSLKIDENFAEKERKHDIVRENNVSRYPTVEEQVADPFHARHYPEEFARFEKIVAKYPNIDNSARAGLYANARLAIAYITEKEDDYSQVGNTRFFGIPDLPPNVAYPKIDPDKENEENLCKFIAQINFAELKGMCDYLPESGILYLFVDSIWDESVFKYKHFFYEGDLKELQKAQDLGIKPSDIYDVVAYECDDAETEEDYEMEPGYRMRIVPFVSVYDNAEGEWYGDDPEEMEEKYEKGYHSYPPVIFDAPTRAINEDLKKEKNIKSPNKWTWAHSKDVQTTNGNTYWQHDGGPYWLAAKELGGKPEDYVLLLNVESFGADGDELHFMISKEDLKNRDFSRMFVDCTWSRG